MSFTAWMGKLSSILPKKSIMLFLVLVCLILYLSNKIKEESIPINSINYRDISVQNGVLSGKDDFLRETVDELRIIKTSIYYSICSLFGKEYFCHWAILVKTENGHMFVVSPTGNGGVDVHEVLDNYIFEEKGYRFLSGGTLGKYLIDKVRFVPKFKINVNDVIKNMLEANRTVEYMLMTMNCQYIVSYVLSLYVDGIKIPDIRLLPSVLRAGSDLLFGTKFSCVSDGKV